MSNERETIQPQVPLRLLRGVTRNIVLTVKDADGHAVDLTGVDVAVTISRDGSRDTVTPSITVTGESHNIVMLTWHADEQKAPGRYTIDLVADYGDRNVAHVNWHGPTGIDLVEWSVQQGGTPPEYLDVDDVIALVGELGYSGAILSSNDYTDADKAKLESIEEGAQVNVIESIEVNGVPQTVTDKTVSIEAYVKPQGGIPKTDMDEGVRASLGKADSALQSETDPTVPAWAKEADKPSYDYSEISNTPTLPDAVEANPTVPAGVTPTALDNLKIGDGYYSVEGGGGGGAENAVLYTAQTLTTEQKAQARTNIGAGTYSKPGSGIPASDMADGVQTSLGKADTALQSFTETDPTVPSWAKAPSKPSYDYSEIANTPSVPTALADLSEDTTHRVVTDTEKSGWNGKADKVSDPTSGNLASLDAGGNLEDSGKAVSDFYTKAQLDALSETWTFTLSDNTTVTKKIIVLPAS